MLTSLQRNRATRLLAILRSAFESHPRTSMLIAAFVEGVNLQRNSMVGFDMGYSGQGSNGFELLRVMTSEFSLRTRAEALSLRATMSNKSFVLSANETTPLTVVTDVVRRLDLECAKYSKLIAKLPEGVDGTGLGIPESDMLLVLLRSLPEGVRNYCLHHSQGETYGSYRDAAMRWEQQQRLFQDMYPSGNSKKQVAEIQQQQWSDAEWYDLGGQDTDWHVDAVQGSKCGKCGSRKHETANCSVDMAKVKGYKCQKQGHVSMNCPERKQFNDKGSFKGKGKKGVLKGDWSKGKGKTKGKDSGKSKGFGKKGKMNEVADESWDESWWWYEDDGWSSWDVSQVWDHGDWEQSWYGNEWQENDKGADEGASQAEGSTPQVQSLMLSPLVSEMFALEDTGLELFREECLSECGSSMHEGLVCENLSDMCVGESVCESGQMFCGCEQCYQESEMFSRACRISQFSKMRCDLFLSGACEQTTQQRSGNSSEAQRSARSSDVAGELCWQPAGSSECNCPSTPKSGDTTPRKRAGVGLLADGLGRECGLLCHGCEREQDSNIAAEALVAPSSQRVSLVRSSVTTFLNDPWYELSQHVVFSKHFSQMFPLLAEMTAGEDESHWWLLDSGASATVMSSCFLEVYSSKVKPMQQIGSFRAANGSAVSMLGETSVVAYVGLQSWENGKRASKRAKLRALVGDTRHNILSTTTLCAMGWEFWQGPKGFQVSDTSTGSVMTDTAYFAGCPWVKLTPSQEDVSCGSESLSVVEETKPIKQVRFQVCPMTRAAEQALEQHRLQGHNPFDPRCVICARSKSVFQHRRRKDQLLESELQADFGFVTQRGEIVNSEDEGMIFKVLVLTELSSNCTGYVLVGTDLAVVRKQIGKWLCHFGFTTQKASIILHTDAERQVADLVGRSFEQFSFSVRRASPQQHQSVGHAERGVRRMKEGLSLLRAEMNQANMDLHLSSQGLSDALTYVALSHNHFSKVHGSEFSPLEYINQRKLSKPQMALFGQTVLAELPDAIRRVTPNETRNVEAVFVHPGLDTGPIVQAKMRVQGEMVLKRFVARNVRAIIPATWDNSMGENVVVPLDNAELPQEIADEVPVAGGRGYRPLPTVEDEDLRREVNDGEDVIEYPDGAPPELIREMKEPNVEIPVRKKRGSLAPAASGAMKMARQGPLAKPKESDVTADPNARYSSIPSSNLPPTSPPVFSPTPRCPACQSGMEAPGIRHNAECKRRKEEFLRGSMANEDRSESEARLSVSGEAARGFEAEDMELEDSEFLPREREVQRASKRRPDVETEELEKEMRDEGDEMVGSLMELIWVDCGEDVVHSFQSAIESGAEKTYVTSPEFFDEHVCSIKFFNHKEHAFVKVALGKQTVLLWKPDEVIDDVSLIQLDPELGYQGMQSELENMELCGTGEVIDGKELQRLRDLHPELRLIQSRWVAAYKSSEKVRTRIVAKDLNRGLSARKLGISSPTPSIESLHTILSMSARRGWRLKSMDVNSAFMHSPLPDGEWIVLKLPLSVSLGDGSPAYLLLHKALNGLRDASLHWLRLLSSSIREINMWADEIEPCTYQGVIYKDGKKLGGALVMAYVDDLLVCSETEEVEQEVERAVRAVVPIKVTGFIDVPEKGGGKLVFIGRHIARLPGDGGLLLGIDPQYLDSTFVEFGITKGSYTAPDVAAHLEKTLSDPEAKKVLSSDAYSKFRLALGKLLWMSQTRHDIKIYLSLIGSQQSEPMHGTEMGLRALLRFLKTDMGTVLRLPSSEYEKLESEQSKTCFLHGFADASFAPFRFNGRKGISGGAVFFEGSLVRTIARQQQSVSLSSCEAELYALQSLSQEAVSFATFTHRLYFGLEEIQKFEIPKILIETDSSSALQLLQGLDIPKRSRHVEIRLAWIRSKLELGHIEFVHREGEQNVADLFTKCLPSRTFMHRRTMGFTECEVPIHDLRLAADDVFLVSELARKSETLAFVEVCCSAGSSLKEACKQMKIPYVGILKDVEKQETFEVVKRFVEQQKQIGYRWVHVHVSTPCGSGSPLKGFSADNDPTEMDREWLGIMKAVGKFLGLGESKSFELPKNNGIWKREETKRVLRDYGLVNGADVFLCQTGLCNKDLKPIGKCLRFMATSPSFVNVLTRRFGVCDCESHAGFFEVNWSKTGYYNLALAKALVHAARASRKDP